MAPKTWLLAVIAVLSCPAAQADLAGTSLFQQETLLSPAKPQRQKEERLSRSIAGYAALSRRFKVERATQGSPNLLDQAFLATLSTKTGKVLDSAWWLSPLKHGKPQYSWTDFTVLFDRVDHLLESHPWLLAWRDAGPGRQLELHALGKQTAEEGLSTFVLPLWREAGLGADPIYTVLARFPDASWIQLNFNDQADSILVAYSTARPLTHPLHWLDALDIRFTQQCRKGEQSSRYAVVHPDGSYQVHTYQRCPQ